MLVMERIRVSVEITLGIFFLGNSLNLDTYHIPGNTNMLIYAPVPKNMFF